MSDRNEKRQRGAAKMARIPIKVEPAEKPLRKPAWIRARSTAGPEIQRLKNVLRRNKLHTVCEEASCPNLGECFAHGTATFMIMGDICTRRCPFCDVAHGRPDPLDSDEPQNLAQTIKAMGLRYVVVTSVDRDDLRDGGAAHFDLMLECGEGLATWQFSQNPMAADASTECFDPIPCRRLADHRKAYLDYEGPVSGGRGQVRRVDGGVCELSETEDDRWVLYVKESREGGLRGRFELVRETESAADAWLLRRVEL